MQKIKIYIRRQSSFRNFVSSGGQDGPAACPDYLSGKFLEDAGVKIIIFYVLAKSSRT
jgi:hypothetical protein